MVLLDVDDLPPSNKMKEQKVSAKEEKERRVDELAVKLKEAHKEYSKIQYKLWAETIDSGQHKSTGHDIPTAGTIWNTEKGRTRSKSSKTIDIIASAVNNIAEKVAVALDTSTPSNEINSDKEKKGSSAYANAGISPRRKIIIKRSYLIK